jgi:hypothetical protein
MTGTRSLPPALGGPTWSAVSAERPCPCCGEAAGCGTADGTDFVHCRLLVSSRPIAGGGWLHVTEPPRRARGLGPGAAAPLATDSSR